MIEKSTKHKCKICGKEFLIISQEKDFYEKTSLPIPQNCPECRRDRRRALRNEKKLYDRKCNKCGENLKSTYAPNSPYIIYCEKCYFNYIGGVE